MSKKLAVTTDLILLDVKAGSGAFMKSAEEARALAGVPRSGRGMGRGRERRRDRHVAAAGRRSGERARRRRAVEVLGAHTTGALREPALLFAAREALELTTDADHDHAVARAAAALDGGAALDRFEAMIEAQGGDGRVVDGPSILPRAPVRGLRRRPRWRRGRVRAEEIGLASVALGAGRLRKGDPIDPAVGIVVRPKIGDRLRSRSPSARSMRGTRTPPPRRRARSSPRWTSPRIPSSRRRSSTDGCRPWGNFTIVGVRLALYLLASLFVGLAVREYARTSVTARLGDPTPRLWGRIALRPRPGSNRSAAGSCRA